LAVRFLAAKRDSGSPLKHRALKLPTPRRVTLGLDPRVLDLIGNVLPQVPPVGIALFDQRFLPSAIPALQRRLLLDGGADFAMLFEIDQPLDAVPFGVTVRQPFAVLIHASNKVVRYPDIGPSAPHMGKNVDKAAHAGILK
jgi:hypothetical protein